MIKNSIIDLQKDKLAGYDESKCLISNLSQFQKKVDASPFSIKIVLSGVEHYRLQNKSYSMQRNDILVVNRGDSIHTRIDSPDTVKGLCIYPPSELIHEVHHALTSKEIECGSAASDESSPFHLTSRVIRSKQHAAITNKLLALVQTLENQPISSKDLWFNFYSSLATLFVEEQLLLTNKLDKLSAKSRVTKEEIYRRIQLSIDYLNDHKAEELKLDELSVVSSLSKYHFIRSFKEFTGKSPYQFLLQLKQKEAKQLINSGLSITEAARQVGYSDPNNLRKALRKF